MFHGQSSQGESDILHDLKDEGREETGLRGCELDGVCGGDDKSYGWWLCDLSLSPLPLLLCRINQDAEGREEAVGASGRPQSLCNWKA